jgi:hypothetical protein
MARAPHGKDLEGPINEVLDRCFEWAVDNLPTGPGGRKLEDSQLTVDQKNRRAEFVWNDGKKARADAQVIGFCIQEEGSAPGVSLFRWAWDDPSFDKAITKHALELKKYGEKRKIEELATLKTMRVHRERCWKFAALAAALSGATAAVGCPVDGKLVFVTIGPLRA